MSESMEMRQEAPVGPKHPSEPVYIERKLRVGIDIGSTSSDVVLLDGAGRVVFSDYRRTIGRPIETVQAQLNRLLEMVRPSDITSAAATGSAARLPAKLLGVPLVNEVHAQATAVSMLYPNLRHATVIEMGGQDNKLIFLRSIQGVMQIEDFALNNVCAAGTGSFLDQQAQRLGIDIEGEFGRLAMQSKSVPRMAGRCSVFAKTDMIHLQQQATPNCDIVAGLCMALARNLKTDLGCGREFTRPIVFTGGVAANVGVVRAIEQVFDLKQDELLVPENHFFTGAIGAALLAERKAGNKGGSGQIRLERLDELLGQHQTSLSKVPLRPPLSKPTLPPPKSRLYEDLLASAVEPIEAYLGVDVGSISTNVAVIDRQNRVLTKAYLMTAGEPLEAVRKGLDIVNRKVEGKVTILGAATTGSGRYLTGDFIGADVVINEITAQAAGAAIVKPEVDTIFEIGGQDSKYISLENGVVVDFEMNHACAAGTGSFLEEQAQRLGIDINGQFAELALASKAPIRLGERCTVFMESDLLSHQQQGAQTGDLVAGLSYSIVANYLNRVVGRRRIGDNICFQGGTAFNKAVWSAFEQVIGKPILVPDHHEVTGAIGAAAIAAEYMRGKARRQEKYAKSSFRGFKNLSTVEYTVESFTCEHCPNHCEIKKVLLPNTEPLYYGSRCDRYNLKKRTGGKKGFGAFEYRNAKLLEFAGLDNTAAGQDRPHKAAVVRIGLPMALINWQLAPLFSRFFKSLGFEVVLSGATTKKTIRRGTEVITAQPCFPVKVAYGHIAELVDKQVDYIFIPSIVSMMGGCPENRYNQLCPYVQSLAYQVVTAFAGKLGRSQILTLPMRLGEGETLLRKGFVELGRKLGRGTSAVRKALDEALAAQSGFEQALIQKGAEIISRLGPEQRLFVLVSRPYNGCDGGVNLQLPKKLADLGVEVMPMDMLDLSRAELTDPKLHSAVYWSYGQRILRAAEVIKADRRLYAIYLSNFGCGPDSFLQTFFKEIMAAKPALQLELDEHSADAGLITRLEAFLESLKHYRPRSAIGDLRLTVDNRKSDGATDGGRRRLYIPYMSDCSYALAACLKSYGRDAEIMPVADETVLLKGRRFTTGKECLPCAITAGEMLNVLASGDVEPGRTAFFMPSASGPCRFGMYNCLHKLILKYAGFPQCDVIAPNQDDNFYQEFTAGTQTTEMAGFVRDAWTGLVGVDLLGKLILRLRPFAKEPAQAQQVYNKALGLWLEAVEARSSLSARCRLMASIAEDFAAVELDHTLHRPRVGVVGEIYVRNHPFANMNIIARLEELGAACGLASLAEWIYYTNFTRKHLARRRGHLGKFLANLAADYTQHRIEKRLAVPLEKRFGPLAEGPIEHIIELARPYLHHSFEGEAILSIGKMVEYYHQGAAGVVNVMPFTCMPSTVVSTQTRRVSTDCGGMPILNLTFDGQADATLPTRLEAFVEQVAQRRSRSPQPAFI